MSDAISRQAAIELACMRCKNCERQDCEYKDSCETMKLLDALPSAQPKRKWTPCSNPPKHHRDVLVRGIEAIGSVNVHKVMQWDVDAWRPTDYAPSIIWEEWSEIYER